MWCAGVQNLNEHCIQRLLNGHHLYVLHFEHHIARQVCLMWGVKGLTASCKLYEIVSFSSQTSIFSILQDISCKDFVHVWYEWFTHKFYELYSCFFITYMHAFLVSCVLLKTCSIEHITKFSPFQLIENCRIYRKYALEHFDTDKYFKSCAQKHACFFFAVGQKICV